VFSIGAVDLSDRGAPAAFTRSLRETGFAVLTGHPVDAARIDAAYAAWGAFFASPRKDAFRAAPGAVEGFFPFRSENAKGSPHKDLKEFFQVYPRTALPAEVETVTRALYADLVALGARLLSFIEENTPQETRARFAEPLPQMLAGSEECMLRVIHYPAQEGLTIEPGAERAAAHEDINLITLLVAGSAPGLQARDTEGRWHEVPCDPGMIVVNVGDMLSLASGGAFPSTTHRVVNPDAGGGARLSMPMFVHPRPEVSLAPGRSAGDYLAERLREIGLAG